MNEQKNNKNRNVHIGLVLAVLGLLILVPIGTADAKIYNTNIWGAGVFNPDSLIINTGDQIVWKSLGYPYTIVSIDGLFGPKYIEGYKNTSYIFDVPGRYKVTTQGRSDLYQTISVNDAPQMKIVHEFWNK